jgi:hypothetical protein
LISVGSVVQIYSGPPLQGALIAPGLARGESAANPHGFLPSPRTASRIDSLSGELAQLGERLVCNQEVTGSSPVFSTKISGRMPPAFALGWGPSAQPRSTVREGGCWRKARMAPAFALGWGPSAQPRSTVRPLGIGSRQLASPLLSGSGIPRLRSCARRG